MMIPRTSSQVHGSTKLQAMCAGVLFVVMVGMLPAGSLDTASGWFPSGTNLTVNATGDLYSQFDRWQGDTNGAVASGNQISFTVAGPRNITAAFKPRVTNTNAVPYEWLANQNSAWTNDFEAAAAGDTDSDGYTTAEEYWSGTDPQDSNSFLHIDAIQITSTNVSLIWMHAKVDTNIPPICVQTRSTMATGGWVYAGEKVPVNGTNMWSASMEPSGFYRLCVTNPP